MALGNLRETASQAEALVFILLDYLCETCDGLSESLEQRGAISPTIPCPCGGTAERTLSPIRVKTPLSSVSRGPSAERPSNALDTRPLAEGMSHKEWRKRYSVR